jgi:ribosomal protein L7/L12
MDIQFLCSFAADPINTLRARKLAYQLAIEIVKTYKPSASKKYQQFDSYPLMTDGEIDTGKNQGKIDAIRIYKNRTGLSLLDSKISVEGFFNINGFTFNYRH